MTTGFHVRRGGNLTSDGTNSYVYDAEGNVTQQGSLTYTYDALNHQVGQALANASILGSGQAFDKDGNFASLWLVSSSNSLSFNGGKAYWNGKTLEFYNSNTAFFEHRDWVGTRRATTNSAATVTLVRTSLPWGDAAANVSGGQDNTFDGYTGLWGGGNSATNHAQFREYWNVAGRWLQPDPYSGSYDPSNPQSFNRYAYVLNNPVRFVDPQGLLCELDASTDADVFSDISDSDCLDNGGTVISDNTTVNVNSSDNSGDILETEQTGNNSTFIQYQQFTGKAPKNQPQPKPWKIHGNYCGPDWTGGRAGEYDPTIDASGGYAPPIDSQDAACAVHDKCYYSCRSTDGCNAGARARCFAACDSNLATSTALDLSLTGQEINLVMTFRGLMGSFHPNEPNAASCQVIP